MIVLLIAVGGHFFIRLMRKMSEWIIEPTKAPGSIPKEMFEKGHPKFATVTSLISSAITFSIYFLAFGLILRELKVSLTAYLATASVVGLAVGFGAQGLVQDIVIGLTPTLRVYWNGLRRASWPGQNALVENTFRQRVLAELKKMDPSYQNWMITVTYRIG